MKTEKILVKRYWIRDLRNNEEWVLDADNINEVIERTHIPRKVLEICRVYGLKKKEKSKLILSY